MFNKFYQNQKGAIAIMMTILILASILSITMVSNTIILNNMDMNIVQVGTTKAFFASEAGAEKILYEVRKKTPYVCNDGQDICFEGNSINSPSVECVNSGGPCTGFYLKEIILSNNSKFSLKYNYDGTNTTIISSGFYGASDEISRKTEVEY